MPQTTDQIVLAPERFQKLVNTLAILELRDVKQRMLLEEIKVFAQGYAPFNTSMAKLVQMIEESEASGET